MLKSYDLMVSYRQALMDLPVSHVWTGYGAALFLEFGAISPTTRRDGSPGQGKGVVGLGTEWGWRIETTAAILCGSDSDSGRWRTAFDRLMGRQVTGLDFLGQLPELELHLTGDLRLRTFTSAERQPQWSIFDRRTMPERWLHVEDGQIVEGVAVQTEFD